MSIIRKQVAAVFTDIEVPRRKLGELKRRVEAKGCQRKKPSAEATELSPEAVWRYFFPFFFFFLGKPFCYWKVLICESKTTPGKGCALTNFPY